MKRPETVSLLTPVLPARATHLPAAAASVAAARALLPEATLEWVVVLDGPGDCPVPAEADAVVRIPQQVGAAAARNVALMQATGEWVYPLDADDVLHPEGLVELLAHKGRGVAWVACNRLTLDGARTAHWHDTPRDWHFGVLPECWTSPFLFHPGSLLVRRVMALEVGGWPALPSNEALGFALALGARASGRFRPEVVTLERHWEGQTNRGSVYAETKRLSLTTIAAMLNARHSSRGEVAPPAGCCEPEGIARDPDT